MKIFLLLTHPLNHIWKRNISNDQYVNKTSDFITVSLTSSVTVINNKQKIKSNKNK